jgi:predicted dehydrogenase
MSFRWGIFGTGTISVKFAVGLRAARDARVSFVASRSLAKAQAFAANLGIERAIEGYAQAVAAGGVDAIYIATPPSEHTAHALMCIEAGIPVLVEKPMAPAAAEVARIAAAARAKSVFAMEAMWTRFLPAAQALRDSLAAGTAGEPRMVAGSFGTSKVPDPASSNFDPALGGGVISHLGVYPLSLAQWLFGAPTEWQALGSAGPNGVDEEAVMQLRYPGGVMASFFASNRAWAANDFRVLGTHGMIAFRGTIVRPHGLEVFRHAPLRQAEPGFGLRARLREHGATHRLAQIAGLSSRSPSKRVSVPYAGNGYHYEADEVRACVGRGAVESRVMPLDDSIAVAATAEAIREAVRRPTNTRTHQK